MKDHKTKPPLAGITFKGPSIRLPQLARSTERSRICGLILTQLPLNYICRKYQPRWSTPPGLQVELETLRGSKPSFLITRREPPQSQSMLNWFWWVASTIHRVSRGRAFIVSLAETFWFQRGTSHFEKVLNQMLGLLNSNYSRCPQPKPQWSPMRRRRCCTWRWAITASSWTSPPSAKVRNAPWLPITMPPTRSVNTKGKRLLVSSDDCCDYQCIVDKESVDGGFDVEKSLRRQLSGDDAVETPTLVVKKSKLSCSFGYRIQFLQPMG